MKVIAALTRRIAMMIFPEGTPTKTGRLGTLEPGFIVATVQVNIRASDGRESVLPAGVHAS